MRHLIGTGILNWSRYERIGDRYGTVILYDPEPYLETIDQWDADPPTLELDVDGLLDARGKLFARILETRQSRHIGDFVRGLFPTTPERGEEILLGTGTLFKEYIQGSPAVGLRPNDDRKHDWLDSSMLYRAHEQTVELWFESMPRGD